MLAQTLGCLLFRLNQLFSLFHEAVNLDLFNMLPPLTCVRTLEQVPLAGMWFI